MAALEQVSRRIDKIVDAITTVSIQTNMLAVNGSIEAARAGEFGKGFMQWSRPTYGTWRAIQLDQCRADQGYL